MLISPLLVVKSDRKVGTHQFQIIHKQIIQKQLNPAIGVSIVRGNAKHELERLHAVEETASANAAHHSANK